MLSVVKLIDVNGEPRVKMELPPLRIGEPIALRFKVERTNGGRHEVLLVDHRFRVIAVGCDARSGTARQLLSVETLDGKSPTWQSIKKPRTSPRRLSPAVNPRTVV